MTNSNRIAVLGGGSWGTALVKVLQYRGHKVLWWVRRETQRSAILTHGHNPDYLSYTQFDPASLAISTQLADVIREADILMLAVPSAFLPSVFADIPPHLLTGKVVISAVKGLDPVSNKPVYEWLINHLGVPRNQLGVIGGPCHSEEVAMQRLSYLTLGVFDWGLGERIREMLETPFLHVGLSEDVQGISLASVLKNVYGILSGITNGLRYGDNFQAVLVSNAIREMQEALLSLTGTDREIQSSVYAGDLLVTSYSGFSRNWMLGNLIGKGYSVKAALLELRMVAEGYFTASALRTMHGLNLLQYPLLESAVQILHEDQPAEEVIRKLTLRLK